MGGGQSYRLLSLFGPQVYIRSLLNFRSMMLKTPFLEIVGGGGTNTQQTTIEQQTLHEAPRCPVIRVPTLGGH